MLVVALAIVLAVVRRPRAVRPVAAPSELHAALVEDRIAA